MSIFLFAHFLEEGLYAAELKTLVPFIQERGRSIQGCHFRRPVNGRSARVAQSEYAGRLVESLSAASSRVLPNITYCPCPFISTRSLCPPETIRHRSGNTVRSHQPVGIDMGFEVVDTHQRQPLDTAMALAVLAPTSNEPAARPYGRCDSPMSFQSVPASSVAFWITGMIASMCCLEATSGTTPP